MPGGGVEVLPQVRPRVYYSCLYLVTSREEFDAGMLNHQQKELLQMGTELQRTIQDPGSAFQNFLKYSPDGLNHLFDRF